MPAIFDQTYGYSLLIFGFFIAVALLAGITMFRQEAKTTGCDPQRIDGLCFWVLIAAILGARLFYFIIHPDALAGGAMELFKIWNGGVSLAGGAAVAAVVGFGYTKSSKMPVLRTLDAFAPAIAIGQFFAWLGCFFSGFCRQQPFYPAWDVHGILRSPEAVAKVHLHPTALFIAAGHFIIFGLLLLLKQRRRFNGQTFWLYVLMFGMLGLVAALFLQAQSSAVIYGPTPSVVINTVLVVAAILALMLLSRRGKKRKALTLDHPDNRNG